MGRSRTRSRTRSRSPDGYSDRWHGGDYAPDRERSRDREYRSSRDRSHRSSRKSRPHHEPSYDRDEYSRDRSRPGSRERSRGSAERDSRHYWEDHRRPEDDTYRGEDRYRPQGHDGYHYDSDDSYRDSRRGRRRRAYARQLEGGLDSGSSRSDDSYSDDDYYYRSEPYYSSRRRDRRPPSSTLHVRGLPESVDEADVHNLLGSWTGVTNVRVMRDRMTGKTRGYAFVEFESVDAAEDVMDSLDREGIALPTGERLSVTYSHQLPGGQSQGGPALDWVCTMCKATNFARRLECHQCSTARPANPQRVATEADMPTNVLKISSVEPQTSDGTLYKLFQQHAAVTEVRLLTDRQGEPKGFGFAEFTTIAEASRALHLLQECEVEGQQKRLRLAFAKNRVGSRPEASAAASNALEAAQAMSAYTGWTPQEFDESALDAATNTQNRNSNTEEGEVPDAAGTSSEGSSEFQYDPASGYYYHAASGYYFDANTGLYFDSADQKWKSYDETSGQYLAVDNQPEQSDFPTSQTEGGEGAAANSIASLHAPEIDYKPPPEAKKRGAVIGSAAKLNPEGVLAAAREAKGKQELEKRKAAQAAAKAKKGSKQVRSQPSAIASKSAQTAQPSFQPAAGVASQGVNTSAASGAIQGVIRSSGKWGKPKVQ